MFTLYDALRSGGRPDPATWGAVHLPSFYEPTLLTAGAMPTQGRVNQILAAHVNSTGLIMLDVETWFQDLEPIAALPLYLQLLAMARAACPHAKFGFYSIPPYRDYWNALKSRTDAAYIAWQDKNTVMRPLAEAMDVMFVSLYTFYNDVSGWSTYARENVREARRLAPGKRIIPFLWPQYHESNATLGGQLISGPYWRLQLDTVANLKCAGAAIWGPPSMSWNNESPWFLETKAFSQDRVDRSQARGVALSALVRQRENVAHQIEMYQNTSISALQTELNQLNDEISSMTAES